MVRPFGALCTFAVQTIPRPTTATSLQSGEPGDRKPQASCSQRVGPGRGRPCGHVLGSDSAPDPTCT